MVGSTELLFWLGLIALVLIFGPRAVIKLWKTKVTAEAYQELAKKRVRYLLSKVEKGEISIDEAEKELRKMIKDIEDED